MPAPQNSPPFDGPVPAAELGKVLAAFADQAEGGGVIAPTDPCVPALTLIANVDEGGHVDLFETRPPALELTDLFGLGG